MATELENLSQTLFKLNKFYKKLEFTQDCYEDVSVDLDFLFSLINNEKKQHVLVEYKLDRIFVKLNVLKNQKKICVNLEGVKDFDLIISAKIGVFGLENYKIKDALNLEMDHHSLSLNYTILMKKLLKSNDFRLFMTTSGINLQDRILAFNFKSDHQVHYKRYFIWKYLKFLYLLNKNLAISLRNGEQSELSIDLNLCLSRLFEEIHRDFDKSGIKHQLNYEILSKYLVVYIQNLNLRLLKKEENVANHYETMKSRLVETNIDFIFKCDDATIIQFLNECLKLNNKLSSYVIKDLDANYLFLKLLISIKFDFQVFIDWLISNETDFLEYFLFYLKFSVKYNEARKNVLLNGFYKDLIVFGEYMQVKLTDLESEMDFVKKYVKFLNDLNIKLNRLKNVFPYNSKPLLNLLKNYLDFFI
jgi:hypothetical protein